MDMIKVTAKTLDEAITKALIQLGTTSDNLDYTILEKGSSGFLGLFSKDVVIEAKKKRDNDLEMEDLFESIKAETQSVKEVKEPKKEKEVPKKEPKEPKKENKKQEQKAEPKKAEQKHKGENKQKQEKAERAEKGEKPEKPVKPEKAEKVEKAEKPEKPERPAKPEKPVNVEACDRSAKEFLSQVFKAMGIEVQVNTSFNESDRELTIDMSGADMGI